jgi:hypothetical protein
MKHKIERDHQTEEFVAVFADAWPAMFRERCQYCRAGLVFLGASILGTVAYLIW